MDFYTCNKAVNINIMPAITNWFKIGNKNIEGHINRNRKHSTVSISNISLQRFDIFRRTQPLNGCTSVYCLKLTESGKKTIIGNPIYEIYEITIHNGRLCSAK